MNTATMKKANEVLNIPTKNDNDHLSLKDLSSEQLRIAAVVLEKIDEYLHCDSPDEFIPLQLTILGGASSGKSFFLKVLLAVIRQRFEKNDVMQIVTSNAEEFNQTYSQFTGLPINELMNDSFHMNENQRSELISKCKNLLCLALDDGSMINTRLASALNQYRKVHMMDFAVISPLVMFQLFF